MILSSGALAAIVGKPSTIARLFKSSNVAALLAFLSFSMIQFRDGPYVRPHPAFWRIVLGINLLYELALVFLLFQDLPNARLMMKNLDPSLGVPLAEKSYAEDCSLTPKTLWVSPELTRILECACHSYRENIERH